MPKQKGIFKIEGKIDDTSFYQRKGVYYARKASKGPTKEQILTSPNYQRTRENLSEFSAMSVAATSFTKAVNKVSDLKDGTLRNRLMKIFRVITKSSDGVRGKRPVSISQFKQHLINVELNANEGFHSLFKGDAVQTHDAARNKATVTITADNIQQIVKNGPSGATHVRFVQLLGVVSNTVYDENLKKYVPADAVVNGAHQVAYSDYISLGSVDPVNIQIQTALLNAPVLSDQVSVIQGLGILFDEKIGNIYYPQKQGRAMIIIDVF